MMLRFTLILVAGLGYAARPVAAWAAAAPAAAPRPRPGFVHPGLLHTRADLERMKRMVAAGQEPWKSGLAALKASRYARADHKLRGPFERAGRGANSDVHKAEAEQDALAAYQNALMWAVTGDEAHARKSAEILDAWSGALRELVGRDVQLGAGLWGFLFANAAEILRHTWPAWPADRVARSQRMLREVFYPPIEDFATFANGNWDAACIKTMMAIAVFCDDRAMFDRAVDYFRDGRGNGRLTHYVVNEAGQCQESGRDQQHAQLGLGMLCEAAEVAWNQGIDLYALADDRLLRGFEYAARYNLGEEVPFVPHVDTTGKYRHSAISADGRGRFRPIYEMAYNHYHHRRGIEMPFTKRVLEKTRPEGAPYGADHPGFGTLLFTRPPAPEPPTSR